MVTRRMKPAGRRNPRRRSQAFPGSSPEQDGSLQLVTGAGKIFQISRLTGLVRAFALHDSVPQAMAGDEHWRAALAREDRGTEEFGALQHGLL
jgi:hypothetical protein